jgi:hypothetical protein
MYIMAITDETIFTEFPYLYNSIIRDEIDIYIDSDKMYLVNVLSSPYDDSIRSFAKEFIKLSIDFSSEKKKTKVDLYSEKDEYKLHSKNINVVIPAYIYSKILMYNGGSDFIIKKFSMGLSMMAENRINEWIESKSTDKWNLLDRLFEVIKKNIAMKLEWKEKHLSNMSPRVGIADFLKYSVNIGFYWNPIFFDIANGYVSIPIYEKKTGRFFREVINELIRDSFKNMKANLSDEILKNEKYKEDLAFIKDLTKKYEHEINKENAPLFTDKSGTSFPPCIVHILKDLGMLNKFGIPEKETGQIKNVPHTGRLSLVCFLNNISYPKEMIIECFSKAPDFKIDYTRYQVNHIVDRNYSMASCDTMRANNLCFSEEDPLCEKVVHPIEFYRKKMKTMEFNHAKVKQSSE